MCAAALTPDQYINRELSWIAFNQRVLAQALDQRTPLLDQAKFSAIFSNNLDEFFMVRVASLKSQVEAGISTPQRRWQDTLRATYNNSRTFIATLRTTTETLSIPTKASAKRAQRPII